MNKNRIRGGCAPDERANDREVQFHPGRTRISGGCASKVAALTSGGLGDVTSR